MNVYMITWVIEESFGGLTTACLHRARVFAEKYGGSHVVTFAFTPKLKSTVERLINEGMLSRSVNMINLYWHLADQTSSLRHNPQAEDRLLAELQDWEPAEILPDERGLTRRTFRQEGGSPREVKTYTREDGTIFLSDEKFEIDGKPKRRLVIYNRAEEPVKTYPSASSLYRGWLREVIGSQRSLAIFDSGFVAEMMSAWQAPRATKVFAFHSSHILPGENPLSGRLSPKHEKIIGSSSSWDGFVFLTEGQRRDFAERFGNTPRTATIPNVATAPPHGLARETPNLKQLVVVGRLSGLKRVDHAIRVVHELRRRGERCRLAIVGEGAKREALEELTRKLNLEDSIVFVGHSNDVSKYLRESSMLLFTSKSEGQGLALLEAQLHGCVPVSYNVPYGPPSLIRHEKDGILVPAGNIDALANAVEALLKDTQRLEKLSRSGIAAAKRYFRMDIPRRWRILYLGLSLPKFAWKPYYTLCRAFSKRPLSPRSANPPNSKT
ncbi:glycosyltransferase [Glutamicibacter creatinolyticus]|uniref:glycosyltransferase n=1 Tax=Glutamicibacter creatinolyticus TaxID=162496 RepID=UPI003216CC76